MPLTISIFDQSTINYGQGVRQIRGGNRNFWGMMMGGPNLWVWLQHPGTRRVQESTNPCGHCEYAPSLGMTSFQSGDFL